MKCSFFATVVPVLALCLFVSWANAQDDSTQRGESAPADTTIVTHEEPELKYEDYTVKAYSLTFFGGVCSGAKYLENAELWERTVLTDGAADILAYDPSPLERKVEPDGVLTVSRDTERYEAAHKELKSGNSFGARIGIYATDVFHLDLTGSYTTGTASTTMLFTEDPDNYPNIRERIEVDTADYSIYKGGFGLMYDAKPASFYGVVPRLGFGLGGIINRVGQLSDKTALYLEGIGGLQYEVINNLNITAQANLSIFSFDVDELSYGNMVSYTTLSVGISWFIDVVPDHARAAYFADLD